MVKPYWWDNDFNGDTLIFDFGNTIATLTNPYTDDFLFQNVASGVPGAIWLIDGGGASVVPGGFGQVVVGGGVPWDIVGAANFTTNQHPDLIEQSDTDGSVRIEFLGGAAGTTVTGSAIIQNSTGTNFLVPGTAWHLAGTGTFDSSALTGIPGGSPGQGPGFLGTTDLLFQNTNGAVAEWYLELPSLGTSGLVLAENDPLGGIHFVGANPGPTWHVVGTADHAFQTVNTGLILNGGFEIGPFMGDPFPFWTEAGLIATFIDGNPHSGNQAAALGNVGVLGSLSQTVVTVPGAQYTLTYFLNTDGDVVSQFFVQWNGVTIPGSVLFNPDFGGNYVEFQFTVTGTGLDTLTIFERDDPSFMFLDDVSLVGPGAPVGPGPFFPGTSGPVTSVIGVGIQYDIYFQNDNGSVGVWHVAGQDANNNPVVTAASVVDGNPGPTWDLLSTQGDFNNNGTNDLLFQNDNGAVAIWLMTPGNGVSTPTLAGNFLVGPNPGPTWEVRGVGDYDGDGLVDDIRFQNSSTGQIADWLLGQPPAPGQVGAPGAATFPNPFVDPHLVDSNPGTNWQLLHDDMLLNA
jgi:hypothetical protein